MTLPLIKEVIGLTGLLWFHVLNWYVPFTVQTRLRLEPYTVKGKEAKINSPLDAKLGMAYLEDKREGVSACRSFCKRKDIIAPRLNMFHPLSKKEMEEAADKLY